MKSSTSGLKNHGLKSASWGRGQAAVVAGTLLSLHLWRVPSSRVALRAVSACQREAAWLTGPKGGAWQLPIWESNCYDVQGLSLLKGKMDINRGTCNRVNLLC